MTHPTKSDQPLDLLAGLLSYLIPGLGQIVQGRVSKGIFFAVVLLSMFHVGLALGNWRNVYLPTKEDASKAKARMGSPRSVGQWALDRHFSFAGQVWIGVAAWPAVWQYMGGPYQDPQNRFWVNYQREPGVWNENSGNYNFDALNAQVRSAENKDLDVGLIYTLAAGLLNLLVIYDAAAGPAFHDDKTKPEPKEKEV